MSWFINESEVEKRGAMKLLSALTVIPVVQLALQRGDSPECAAQELVSFFRQQTERIAQLEQALSICQNEKQQGAGVLAMYRRDLGPNYERIQQLEQELNAESQRADRADQNASDLHDALERERRLNAEAIAELQADVQEQQSIIAQQHLKLQELLGTDTQIPIDPL